MTNFYNNKPHYGHQFRSADVRRYTSSILQFLVAYFISRKSVGYLGFEKAKKWPRMQQILHFTNLFKGRATIFPLSNGEGTLLTQ